MKSSFWSTFGPWSAFGPCVFVQVFENGTKLLKCQLSGPEVGQWSTKNRHLDHGPEVDQKPTLYMVLNSKEILNS
jgi:hypothetical protein